MSRAFRPAGGSDRILKRLLALHPKRIDLVLDRVYRLLAAMGDPQLRLPPVVHVAGTNGKGSVTAMVRAGLRADGAKVHVYTSPHLVRFSERIVLASRRVPEAALCRLLARCEAANDGRPITFFEITTVAALLAFAETEADYCLLEVGLGGRLDATNVVPAPAVTAITRIGYDHQQYLGTTLGAIAGEKAGILKPDTVGVIGPQRAQALRAVERQAAGIGAPLLRHGHEWDLRGVPGGLAFTDGKGSLQLPLPALPGAHQLENAGVAVAILRQLGAGSPHAALRTRNWPARLQRLRRGPVVAAAGAGAEIWLDGGHNQDAAGALASEMRRRNARDGRPLVLICGMLDTKDAGAFLGAFRGLAGTVYAVSLREQESGVPAPVLAQAAAEAGLPTRTAASVLDAARSIAGGVSRPRVLICGSLHLAGEVLAMNEKSASEPRGSCKTPQ